MNGVHEGVFRLVVYGTPIVAGGGLLLVLFVKELRPALIAGFAAALLFGLIGGASVGDAFGRSGMGADWGAMIAMVLITLYACAGFLVGLGVAACLSPRHRIWAPIAFIAGLAVPVGLPVYRAHLRTTKEQLWVEKQERQRQSPHALVNDIALSDEEDSGYRIRFVDDEGVVRARSDVISVVPYVVLPPGKHRLLLKADTPKGERMKLPWVLKETVEVQAGRRYSLRVNQASVALIEVERFKEPLQR
jgi:hypothetical protein